MNIFLEKYLQLSNKNQNIIISVGQKQNNYTFNNEVPKNTIHKIIQCINNTYKIKKKYCTETIYQKGNEQIKSVNDELTYSIIKDADTLIDNKYLLKWRKYTNDGMVIPSYNIYDHIYKKEILEFLIENSFTCKVIIVNDLHSLDIVFHKPCNIKKVLDFLKQIEQFY